MSHHFISSRHVAQAAAALNRPETDTAIFTNSSTRRAMRGLLNNMTFLLLVITYNVECCGFFKTFAAFARAYFAAWRHRLEQYRARASEAVNPRPQWAQA